MLWLTTKCYHNDLADANHLTGYCHTGDTKSQYNFKIFTLRGMNIFALKVINIYKQTCWRCINMTYTYANLEARLCCLFSLWLLLHEHMKFWWHGLSGIIKKICVQILSYLFSIFFLEKKFFGWIQKTILDQFILLLTTIYLIKLYLFNQKIFPVKRLIKWEKVKILYSSLHISILLSYGGHWISLT